MLRKLMLAAAAALALAAPAAAQGYKDTVKEFRVGLIGGENATDLLTRNEDYRKLLETELGIPVKLYPATDYAGIMQAIGAGQVELAAFGASGFAGAYLDCNKCIEPLVVAEENDGSTFYYSVAVARADSGINSLDDAKGKSLAFADPNSTSGYLIPNATLKAEGKDPEKFFSRVGFAGGHEQGVLAVLNKQYDVAVTWTSGQGDINEGYSRGNLRAMVDKKLLDMKDVKIIWQSGKIPNGPVAIRADLPADLKEKLLQIHLDLPVKHPAIYQAIERGTGKGYAKATLELYEDIIKLRQAEATGGRKN
ncbi:MAG: phosphonate ABC transporter substrate-binding protein [Pseudochelatococcus sp.]|jgi:phosphonate transport system substrate-binding protein|uniref:phosphonate ABC transporter substrate-binding protein n=1 Tax=Pseudochelatococcus sp. TaxID=2020869 RepID=UPI003D91E1A9